MSINGSNNDLSFHIFNVSEHKYHHDFDEIADLFEKSEKKLCMRRGEKAIDLYEYFDKRGGFRCDYVYYIKNEKNREIIAFAFIKKYEGGQNIYTVSILCSHTEKYELDDEKAGIFLLNKIYDDFVSKGKGVLRIEPATEHLIPYYTKWKTPSYSPFNSEAVDTTNYLLYFENIDNITDEMLYELVFELNLLRFVKKNIPGIDSSSFVSKKELEERIEAIEKDGIKQQLKNILRGIKYFTIEEYRNHIGQFENNIRAIEGGKRKSRKKKKYLKRKSRKVRKSHKRRR